jgi:hypothetical protein
MDYVSFPQSQQNPGLLDFGHLYECHPLGGPACILSIGGSRISE